MATIAGAKKKYVDKVTDPDATKTMADKLSTYLGISVSTTAAPIRNFAKRMENADALFDRLIDNMKEAYK